MEELFNAFDMKNVTAVEDDDELSDSSNEDAEASGVGPNRTSCQRSAKLLQANNSEDSQGKAREYLRMIAGKRYDGLSCLICGRKLASRYSLICHMRIHAGVFPHLCCICGAKFRQRPTLNAHVACHVGIFKITCQECGHKFRRRFDYDRHRLQYNHCLDENDWPCTRCNMTFRFQRQRIKHMAKCGGKLNAGHQCPHCQLWFRTRDRLRGHILRSSSCRLRAADPLETAGGSGTGTGGGSDYKEMERMSVETEHESPEHACCVEAGESAIEAGGSAINAGVSAIKAGVSAIGEGVVDEDVEGWKKPELMLCESRANDSISRWLVPVIELQRIPAQNIPEESSSSTSPSRESDGDQKVPHGSVPTRSRLRVNPPDKKVHFLSERHKKELIALGICPRKPVVLNPETLFNSNNRRHVEFDGNCANPQVNNHVKPKPQDCMHLGSIALGGDDPFIESVGLLATVEIGANLDRHSVQIPLMVCGVNTENTVCKQVKLCK